MRREGAGTVSELEGGGEGAGGGAFARDYI